ncbi:SSI family serine proteinase inhibitor [Streptomonospora litoralis]|uniref:Protease inhibitor SIL-V2 n=1 Tax=Streptomonospora litoralis TaxID=2498135 RepID=A0A4V0ZJ35_9ACTN|nr:SSI family serine proteinase inhibitor [Streptomonospora litoralis]QBI52102.1 Protease inhibitor SIL-V2 [Streptomonospora litoralis]
MLRRIAAGVGAAGAAALLCSAAAAPAAAQESSSTLEITVERAGAGTLDRYWLNCDPDFGTHPRPQEACAHLRESGGDLERLRSGAAYCPPTESPVEVRITGTWREEPVDFRVRYANGCYARVVGGPVVPSAWE